MKSSIRQRKIFEFKLAAHVAKHALRDGNRRYTISVGTEQFGAKAVVCSEMLLGEYFADIKRMRLKLFCEKRHSKRWRKIANEIMDVLKFSCRYSGFKNLAIGCLQPRR